MATNKPWYYLSAYALAVKHGFNGTEQEWLALLKGEQGIQGIQGIQGESAYEVAKRLGGDTFPYATEQAWSDAVDEAKVEAAGFAAQAQQKVYDADGYAAMSAASATEAAASAQAAQVMAATPTVVTSTADMTDSTKLYVLIDDTSDYDGYYYYHNGTEFVPGAAYNSAALNTDDSLTVSGAAADAKAVGDSVYSLSGKDVEKLTLQSGTITLSNDPAPVNTTPAAISGWSCAVKACVEGDVFTVTGLGGNGPRLWAFLDATKKTITKAVGYAQKSALKLIAPENAAYFVFNDNNTGGSAFKNITPASTRALAAACVNDVRDHNCYDCLEYANLATETKSGVTFSPVSGGIRVTGTATGSAIYRMVGHQVDSFAFKPNHKYRIKHSSQAVELLIYSAVTGTALLRTFADAEFTTPGDTSKFQAQLLVSTGVTVNEVVKPQILETMSNQDLTSSVERFADLMPEDLVPRMRHTNVTSNGVTWTWSQDHSQITVSGTATAGSASALVTVDDDISSIFQASREYYLDFVDPDVHIAVRAYDSSNNQLLYTDFNTPSYFGLPTGTAKVAMTLLVSAGTVPLSKTISAPRVYERQTLGDITTKLGQIAKKVGYADQIPTESECHSAFLGELNKLAASWGMSSTTIASPSGLETDSYMTVADMMKAAIGCSGNSDLLEICSVPNFTLSIYGQHKRDRPVQNTYLNGNARTIGITRHLAEIGVQALGGKGGNLDYRSANNDPEDFTRTQMTFADISGHTVAICVMAKRHEYTADGETKYRLVDAYQVCTDAAKYMKDVYDGVVPDVTSLMQKIVEDGGGYLAMELPKPGILYANHADLSYMMSHYPCVGAGITNSNRPCSVLKMMTTFLALKYIVDKSAFLSLNMSDITGGSGSSYYVGDKINIMDLLKAMLVESSNTLATAVSRHIGGCILSGRRVYNTDYSGDTDPITDDEGQEE